MTLADVLRLLDNAPYRRNAAMRCWNPQVRDFWLKEFENYPKTFRLEAIAPIQNKVGAFVTDPVLRAILLSGPSLVFLVRAVCPQHDSGTTDDAALWVDRGERHAVGIGEIGLRELPQRSFPLDRKRRKWKGTRRSAHARSPSTQLRRVGRSPLPPARKSHRGGREQSDPAVAADHATQPRPRFSFFDQLDRDAYFDAKSIAK